MPEFTNIDLVTLKSRVRRSSATAAAGQVNLAAASSPEFRILWMRRRLTFSCAQKNSSMALRSAFEPS
jgi:hypothetical protein